MQAPRVENVAMKKAVHHIASDHLNEVSQNMLQILLSIVARLAPHNEFVDTSFVLDVRQHLKNNRLHEFKPNSHIVQSHPILRLLWSGMHTSEVIFCASPRMATSFWTHGSDHIGFQHIVESCVFASRNIVDIISWFSQVFDVRIFLFLLQLVERGPAVRSPRADVCGD